MLTDIDLDSIHYIAFNMRECDKEEIFNVLDYDCPYQFGWDAYTIFRNKGRARIGWHRGKPAAVVGLVEERPTVWIISLFGTDDLKHVMFEIMRWGRHAIAELATEFGGRRMQCDSRATHHESHQFLRALGARQEGEPMLNYGKDGGTYLRFVWVSGKDGWIRDRRYVGVARRDIDEVAHAD